MKHTYAKECAEQNYRCRNREVVLEWNVSQFDTEHLKKKMQIK